MVNPVIAVSFDTPAVGEHTIAILEELKFTNQQISDMQKNNAVYQAEITSKL